MDALTNTPEISTPARRSAREATALSGIVIILALLTCTFIVALPLLGSLLLAAAILALFAGVGLATIFALSRI